MIKGILSKKILLKYDGISIEFKYVLRLIIMQENIHNNSQFSQQVKHINIEYYHLRWRSKTCPKINSGTVRNPLLVFINRL